MTSSIIIGALVGCLVACVVVLASQVRDIRGLRARIASLTAQIAAPARTAAELRAALVKAEMSEAMRTLKGRLVAQMYGPPPSGPFVGLDAWAPDMSAQTADEARAAAARQEAAAWAEKVAAYDKAMMEAKARLDSAPAPSACVYADCDEEPSSSIVDTAGHVTGLCDRHVRHWPKLDEDGRRRVRVGS